jgi:hypothetical protein
MKTKSLDLVPFSSILPFMAMAMHHEVQHSLITKQSDTHGELDRNVEYHHQQ